MNKKFLNASLILILFVFVLRVPSFTHDAHSVVRVETLAIDEWFEVNSTTLIGTDHFIVWEFTQSVADAALNVWAMDDTNFQNFIAHVPFTYYDLSFGLITGDYFIPISESIWHVVFWNVDAPLDRTTTVTAKVEFDEQTPTQNDGNTGGDANPSYSSPTFLDEDDFNSSGMLIFHDVRDLYKFYIGTNESVTLTITGLYDANCNFYLIDPLVDVVASSENMTQDFQYEFTTEFTYYFMIFNKTFTDPYVEKEVYYFDIQIDNSTENETDSTVEMPIVFIDIISGLLSIPIISAVVIIKKKY